MNEADYTQIRLLEAALDNPGLMKEGEVPLFINEGDKIKVETAKGTYKERVKE